MTLNMTAVDSWILQVSDRRLSVLHNDGTVKVVDDRANKAIVLCCMDATLAITFTGLGRYGGTAVDEWVVDTIQSKGLSELDANAALAELAQAATAWFSSFRHRWNQQHIFIVAGWLVSGDRPPQSRVWRVMNSGSNGEFEVTTVEHHRGHYFLTGCNMAFKRPERRRLQAALKQSKSFGGVEAAFVAAIRNAAENPKGEVIGKNCMAIALMPNRSVFARFYSEGSAPRNFGPNVAWYSGGRNLATKGVDYLADGPYAIAIGSSQAPVLIRPASSVGDANGNQIHAGFHLKVTNAVHHKNAVIEDTDLIRVLSLADLPDFLT